MWINVDILYNLHGWVAGDLSGADQSDSVKPCAAAGLAQPSATKLRSNVLSARHGQSDIGSVTSVLRILPFVLWLTWEQINKKLLYLAAIVQN
jgi:hypothetical protein